MNFGKLTHVSALKVHDIVRMVRGGLMAVDPKLAPPISYTTSDGATIYISSTCGWRPHPLGSTHDYRSGYDAMTVMEVDDEFVSFHRPYIYDGKVGVEVIGRIPRKSGALWYEVL